MDRENVSDKWTHRSDFLRALTWLLISEWAKESSAQPAVEGQKTPKQILSKAERECEESGEKCQRKSLEKNRKLRAECRVKCAVNAGTNYTTTE